MSNQREHWGSRIGFILAASGSAVGLGNIWKFPHMAGENGGAAFTIVYLLCILIVGLPIVIGFLIGLWLLFFSPTPPLVCLRNIVFHR